MFSLPFVRSWHEGNRHDRGFPQNGCMDTCRTLESIQCQKQRWGKLTMAGKDTEWGVGRVCDSVETRSNTGSLAEVMVRFWGLWILSSEENPTSQDVSSAMQNREYAATNVQPTSHLLWTARMKTKSLYLSTASWICLIQLLRSSLELVWTSYISGPADEALIRNIPLSSLATSLTMSLWREITEGFWSWGK